MSASFKNCFSICIIRPISKIGKIGKKFKLGLEITHEDPALLQYALDLEIVTPIAQKPPKIYIAQKFHISDLKNCKDRL